MDLVMVEQDFVVRRHSTSVNVHERGEAVMAQLVELSDSGVILDASVSVDSNKNLVQLNVTVEADGLADGVLSAITAMRNAIHAAGDATPGWPSSHELLEMVASAMRAEVVTA